MKRFLVFWVAFFLCTGLCAQSHKWDAALDQYQEICDRCIDLRNRSLSGESISSASLTELLSQLSVLRKTLQEAGGEMTPAQELRFETIRRQYEVAFGLRRADGVPVPRPEPLHARCSLPHIPETGRPSPEPFFYPILPSEPLRWGILGFAGVPDPYFGLMGTLVKGRFGGFAKGSFPFTPAQADYTCRSDGTTPDGGLIWTTGRERVSRWSFSAGGIYAPRSFLSIYAGGGYGSRTCLWEDDTSRWAAVEDRSAGGLVLDAGLVFSFRHLSLLAGVSCIGLKAFSAEIGLGLGF